jgi:phage replication O-like protein O
MAGLAIAEPAATYDGDPQLEDGFTRIANELIEAVMRQPWPGGHLRIVLALIRFTYGYNKKADTISYGQVAKATGLHRTHVIKAMGELVEARVIVKGAGGRCRPVVWSVNKHYLEWLPTSSTATTSSTCADSTATTSTSSTRATTTSSTQTTHQRQKDRKTEIGADAPPSPKLPRKSKTSAPPLHPALVAYQEEAHLHVTIAWRPQVIEAVGDDTENIAFWRQVVHGYMGTYANRANVKAMLEFYQRRQVPGTSGPSVKPARTTQGPGYMLS